MDYIGDCGRFEEELKKHAAVMDVVGGYKLSIHTGLDKFSIYSCIAQHTRYLVHVKTAGTSYLEALHVIAFVRPDLFKDFLNLSRARYEINRASYHVSGTLEKVPASEELSDRQLSGLLDQFGWSR